MKLLRNISASMGVLVVGMAAGGCAVQRVNNDIDTILGVYRHEVQKLKDDERAKASVGGSMEPVAATFSPWWHEELEQVIFGGERQAASLDDIYAETLMNSSQIRVFTDLPLIRRTGIQEAGGEFDTRLFVEARYDKRNDPVGSTLTTGDPTDTRFREHKHSLTSGLRKKIITGGEFELSQELNRVPHNNSTFFQPNPQGNAELRLRYTQPILKGGGIQYNESTIKIAELDSLIAQQEFIRQTESHLVEVARAYWGLYMARAVFLQKQRHVAETLKVVEELQSRSSLDAESAQMARAKAAHANRRADLVRSELAIHNAQDRLKALVNSDEIFFGSRGEFIPLDAPAVGGGEVSLMAAAAEALENRPEIDQAFKQLRAAAYREDMARNEVLPTLNLFVQGYWAGLQDGNEYTQAWDNQFDVDTPGYAFGAYAEFPLENQTGRARLDRRKLESRQQLNTVTTTIETVLLELKVSVREVNTALRDLQAKKESLIAAKEELDRLSDRRALEVGSDLSASSFLTLLLDSQGRLAVAEEDFARSLVTYNVSMINLERAKGTLLKYEDISQEEYRDEETDLPAIRLVKNSDGKSPRGVVTMNPGSDSSASVETDGQAGQLQASVAPAPDEPVEADTVALNPDVSGSPTVQPEDEVAPVGDLPQATVAEVTAPEPVPAESSVAVAATAVVDGPEKPLQTNWSAARDEARAPIGFLAFASVALITGVAFGISKFRK